MGSTLNKTAPINLEKLKERLTKMEAFKIEIDASDKIASDQYNQALEIIPQIFSKEAV